MIFFPLSSIFASVSTSFSPTEGAKELIWIPHTHCCKELKHINNTIGIGSIDLSDTMLKYSLYIVVKQESSLSTQV